MFKKIAFIGLFLSFTATATPAIDSKVLTDSVRDGHADVLVYMKSGFTVSMARMFEARAARVQFVYATLKQEATYSQRQLVQLLKDRNVDYQAFYLENVVSVPNATLEDIQAIAQLPEVESIRPNLKAGLKPVPIEKRISSESVNGIEAHLEVINVVKVWNELGVKGRGIVIAGQDTGFFWTHNAIRNQYRGNGSGGIDHNYNWHDAFDKNSPAPHDDGEHGTHTMGTMVGDDGRGNQIGVAPEAKWIGCRNMDHGVGTVASYLECFEFMLAPYPIGGSTKDGRPEMAPHIVNNSWGCPASEGCKGDEFLGAVRAMNAAGIMVVTAAGNEGPACGTISNAPGHYAGDVIAVGAYNRYGKDIASFSSRGPSGFNGGLAPNIVAPGESIRSSVPGSPDKYSPMAGTSMASPQVAGVVALLWSAHPELIGKIERTMDILQKTARPLTSTKNCGKFPGTAVPNAIFGYGMVNAYDAIKAADTGT